MYLQAAQEEAEKQLNLQGLQQGGPKVDMIVQRGALRTVPERVAHGWSPRDPLRALDEAECTRCRRNHHQTYCQTA